MEQILEIRGILISCFKKYELYIGFFCKFMLGVIIYSLIGSIGYASPLFSSITTMPLLLPYILLMSVLFAVLPLNASYAFMILNITMQFSSKLEVAAIICLGLLLIFFFYARLGGKESALLIATFLAFYFKIPYGVPIIAGMYFGLTSIIPVALGVLLWNLGPLATVLGETAESAGTSIMDMPATFAQLYLSFSEALKGTSDWAVTAFVFAMVIIVVFVVSRLEINYAKELAIILGAAVNILCFLLAALVADVTIGFFGMFISTLVCTAIVFVIQFFDVLLDYQRAEKVEFEDEENYYYVKVVPKIMAAHQTAQKQKTAKTVKEPKKKAAKPPRNKRGKAAPEPKVPDGYDDPLYDDFDYEDYYNSPRRYDEPLNRLYDGPEDDEDYYKD